MVLLVEFTLFVELVAFELVAVVELVAFELVAVAELVALEFVALDEVVFVPVFVLLLLFVFDDETLVLFEETPP